MDGKITNRDLPVNRWERRAHLEKAKSRFYKVAKNLFKHLNKNLHQYFEIKERKYHFKTRAVDLKNQFGSYYIGSAFNFVSPSLLRKGKAMEAAQKLWKKAIQSFPMVENENVSPRIVSEELCMGISIDIAERLLWKGESLEAICSSFKEGASSKAFANQAVYRAFLEASPKSKRFRLSLLNELQAFLNHPSLNMADAEKIEALFLELKDHPDGLKVLQDKMNDEKDPAILVNLKLVYALIQHLNDENVPSSLSHHIIQSIAELSKTALSTTMNELAGLRNVQLANTVKEMGISRMMHSDQEYLANLSKLEDGCYSFLFYHAGGAHAITLVRERGIDTIIDPNAAILRCPQEETAGLLSSLLSKEWGYASPDPHRKQPHHKIIIQKFEKAAS